MLYDSMEQLNIYCASSRNGVGNLAADLIIIKSLECIVGRAFNWSFWGWGVLPKDDLIVALCSSHRNK